MYKHFGIALLLVSTTLMGLASPVAIFCVPALPDQADCIGAGGTCGKDLTESAAELAVSVPPTPDEAAAELECASRGNDQCDNLGRWTVRASFTEGSGTLSISALCGSTSVASCATEAATVPCEQVGDSGSGTFKCIILIDGAIDAEDVTGECVDPVDPSRVVAATILFADQVLTR